MKLFWVKKGALEEFFVTVWKEDLNFSVWRDLSRLCAESFSLTLSEVFIVSPEKLSKMESVLEGACFQKAKE